jgi:hypothetical protein
VALSTSVPIATPARPVARAHAAGRIPRPLASVRFDWAIVVASGWFIGGVYLDGWAHNTFPSLETFFTPWHAVMYSGFLAMMAVLGWAMGRNHVAGRSWWDAIPAGYELSLVGGLLFLAGGVGDMLWHFAFGIEADLEALLSPTHLLLLLGGALLLTGPVRADVRRRAADIESARWSTQLPRLLALTYVLAALAFFTQYTNLWGGPWLVSAYQPLTTELLTAGGRWMDAVFLVQAVSVAGVLVQSALLAGFIVVALRPGRVPVGGFTLMIGLYVVLTVLMRQKFGPSTQLPLAVAGLLTGVVADLLSARLRPSWSAPGSLRAFAALVPAVATAASILALAAAQGTWWTVHLWTGAIVLAAGTGWLVGFLASSSSAAP